MTAARYADPSAPQTEQWTRLGAAETEFKWTFRVFGFREICPIDLGAKEPGG